MDAGDIFRQGFNTYAPLPASQPRPISYHAPHAPRFPGKPSPMAVNIHYDIDEVESHPARIAHTLTACTRCRQRKTRCDPTLPRCLPCERSGSVCEYFDATKGRKIGRNYVVKLQEKVRQLEAELGEYVDEDNERTRSNEDVVRPGGLVRLSDSDEVPRYLGPSSGIAMTRLLMEQAKMFTDSKRISELIPEVRARRQTRMQSIVMANPKARKKSYPITSAHPAKSLPARHVSDRLVDVFCQRSQVFWPTLHEKNFLRDLEDVFAGGTDPYKNFVVRLVFAISLQKLDIQYAGLADSYYLAAMEYFEEVVRSKDLKTLQCLALIGQYSLLTPTRMSIYHVVGLATKICQAEGLADEKTISAGYSMGLVDPLTLDMRRRLVHIIASMELGLAHSMGRPNGLAKGDDFWDIEPFAMVDDEHITTEGISAGPPSEKKLVAIHFFKLRLLQAEIKRSLYEKKRPEPRNETHPWFAKMERRIQDWLEQSPENPPWCKPWFSGRAHQMRIFLHRPCPQIPRPSARSAKICYEGAAYIINLSRQQMERAAVDITWTFLLNLFMALNTLLWTTSYVDIRKAHSRDEVDELVQTALDIVDQEQCSQRWPGSGSASNLYSIFSRACLQIYDAKDAPTMGHFNASPSLFDMNSPPNAENSSSAYQSTAPQFGAVFNATPETMTNYGYDANFPPPQPTFRSNSIFAGPSTDPLNRRYSVYAPESPLDDQTPPSVGNPAYPSSISPPSSTTPQHQHHLPTPPDSLAAPHANAGTPGSATSTISPPSTATPTMPQASPAMSYTTSIGPVGSNMSPPPHTHPPHQPQPPQSGPAFPVQHAPQGHRPPQHPPQPAQPTIQQRPLPPADNIGDWFSPPPPFLSPYNFSPMSHGAFHGGGGGGVTSAPQGPGAVGPTSSGFPPQLGAGAGPGLGQFGFGPFGGLGGAGGAGVPFGQQSQMTLQGQQPGQGPQYPQEMMMGGGWDGGYGAERQGSLSKEQQVELINALETDGMGEIDAFLNMSMVGPTIGPNGGGVGW